MTYHIVTGDLTAIPLAEAMNLKPEMLGEIVVIKDVLSVGPLKKAEGQKFSELRTAFWQDVVPNEKSEIVVDDLDRLLRTGNELSKNPDAKIWLWVGQLPADVCTYLWVMKHLAKYRDRISILNIAGLPFLDDSGKLFFPASIAHLPAKEVIKARLVARPVTQTEAEADAEDWDRLTTENAPIRTLEGVKKIVSRPNNQYDDILASFCSQQFQKASRIVSQAIAKYNIPTGDLFLGWRLRQMALAGKLQLQGEETKTLRDFEVKLREE